MATGHQIAAERASALRDLAIEQDHVYWDARIRRASLCKSHHDGATIADWEFDLLFEPATDHRSRRKRLEATG